MPFLWDEQSGYLLKMYADSWAQPCDKMTPRRELAALFSVRVARRCAALGPLFHSGLYDQSVPLIRAAYEDWLTVGTILSATQSDDQRAAAAYRRDVAKTEAQMYKSFGALAGSKVRRRLMGTPPKIVVELSKQPASKLRVSGNWAAKAERLSLRAVHDFVHPYLSELSHGSMRNYEFLVTHDVGDSDAAGPRPLERDAKLELGLGLWAFWFQLRVLTIAAKERDIDFEPFTDGYLREFGSDKDTSIYTCCFHRERPVAV